MRHPRRTLLAAATLASLILPGCVTSTQATRLQKDLDDVKRQIFQVQQDTAGSRTQIDELSKRLAGGGSTAPDGAGLQSAIRGLLDQIQALTERLDEMKARMATLTQEIQAIRAPGARSQAAQDGSSTGVPPPAASGGGAADQAFKTAYADYSKGNYELAVMGFGDFLKNWGGHPLAPDAQYWIGESLYSQGKYKESAEAMERLVEKYPGSEKTPAALLKKGYAQIESRQTPAGVTTLQRLIEKYPQTDEAHLASERLKQLGLRAH